MNNDKWYNDINDLKKVKECWCWDTHIEKAAKYTNAFPLKRKDDWLIFKGAYGLSSWRNCSPEDPNKPKKRPATASDRFDFAVAWCAEKGVKASDVVILDKEDDDFLLLNTNLAREEGYKIMVKGKPETMEAIPDEVEE